MAITDQKKNDRFQLADELRISFVNVLEQRPDQQNSSQAANAATIRDIEQIEKIKYESYGDAAYISTRSRSQRNATKDQAKRIADLAKKCEQLGKNELEWRLSLEPEIFRRFSTEVTCPKCHARTWRSEIEANYPSASNCFAELKERRNNRTECDCYSQEGSVENSHPGINMIFDDRADKPIANMSNSNGKPVKKERPDRIFGFIETKRFREALNKAITESKREIKYTPFVDDKHRQLLFPFLICEAKSEKSRDTYSDIELQTKFSIQTLLEIQEGLQNETSTRGIKSPTCPLVWFFAYKGADWRMYICYTGKDRRGNPNHEVYHQWSGCIKFNDNALTLLLIIDYIFDWARDIYRTSILSQLEIISTNGFHLSRAATQQSDILSAIEETDDSSTDHQKANPNILQSTPFSLSPSVCLVTPDSSDYEGSAKDDLETLNIQSDTTFVPRRLDTGHEIILYPGNRVSKRPRFR